MNDKYRTENFSAWHYLSSRVFSSEPWGFSYYFQYCLVYKRKRAVHGLCANVPVKTQETSRVLKMLAQGEREDLLLPCVFLLGNIGDIVTIVREPWSPLAIQPVSSHTFTWTDYKHETCLIVKSDATFYEVKFTEDSLPPCVFGRSALNL